MKRALSIYLAIALVLLGVPWTNVEADAPIILDSTAKSLELETSAAVNTDFVCSWTDNTPTAFTPGSTDNQITTATTTTLVAAPAASTQRAVKLCTVSNLSATTPQTVTFKYDSGTERRMRRFILSPGEYVEYSETGGFREFNANGIEIQIPPGAGYTGRTYEILKVTAGAEAIGVRLLSSYTGGVPGAWVPGTPGVNGAVTNCDAAAGAAIIGSHVHPDPASGSLFLTGASFSATLTSFQLLLDPVWYNTGLSVTTTTAQNITQPTLPARDIDGTNNGVGWNAAIFVATATTNAGAITNMTLSYTDDQGNAGNTATITSFPATAVQATLVPFELAAGDRGIRSIQSITLGTSLVTGTISILHYRLLYAVPSPTANVGQVQDLDPPGIRLYNDTCIVVAWIPSATSVNTVYGNYRIMEK